MTLTPFSLPPLAYADADSGHETDHADLAAIAAALGGQSILNTAFAGGADPTGVADSSAAVNAAMAAGTFAFVPPGTYKIAAALNPTGSSGLIGCGNSSRFTWDGSAVPTLIKAAGTTAVQSVSIRDLRLSQSNATPSGTAIDASYFQFSRIERLLIDKTSSGAEPLAGVVYNSAITFYNVLADSVIHVEGASSVGVKYDTGSNSNELRNCRILPSGTDATSTGIYVNAHAIELHHPDIEGAAGVGVDIAATGHNCLLLHAYLESNGTNLRLASGVNGPTVIGGTIETGVSADITDNGALNPVMLNVRSSASGEHSSSRFPARAGAPSGTPLTGSASFVYDTTNHKLWVFDGGSWKGVVLS